MLWKFIVVGFIVVGREKDTQELSCEDFHHRVKVYLGHNNDSIFVIDNIKSHSNDLALIPFPTSSSLHNTSLAYISSPNFLKLNYS